MALEKRVLNNQTSKLTNITGIEIMNRNLRPLNISATQNAWRGVVRGFSLSNDCGCGAPKQSYGYQPEHIQPQVHSEGWDG